MLVYFDEIDGDLHAKWVLLEARVPEDEHTVYYSTNQDVERFYPEDFHDDLKALSISMNELVNDFFDDHRFGININLVKKRLHKSKLSTENIYELDYFILLCDDLEELAEINLPNLP
ncbi:hypothetical protein [Salibacterium halotolerans]|uniref:Uncharacterized protein n=1 Tax=Salibacterium halotolerans TaxID=1884432 RepID=A0A1I5MI12_9BACI|nr:hypothetical protein [Salibacterium halotolerans]SFP09278.1 hypothetical protein SAMN05518683_102246 [Salibacterium halotolerans]